MSWDSKFNTGDIILPKYGIPTAYKIVWTNHRWIEISGSGLLAQKEVTYDEDLFFLVIPNEKHNPPGHPNLNA